MTVYVKTGNIRLWFPVPLLLLRLAPLVPDKYIPEMGLDIKKATLALYRALKQVRRDFPGLELVHVRSAGGEEVIVKL